jgi:hypothetical protein
MCSSSPLAYSKYNPEIKSKDMRTNNTLAKINTAENNFEIKLIFTYVLTQTLIVNVVYAYYALKSKHPFWIVL